ncbi:hypothetical protein P9112_008852 [Eukaryota sp. TZLM1-RC]
MTKFPYIIGIRHETLDEYERRCPLIPSDVKKLVDQGVKVLVERSGVRIFPDAQYERAGAELVEDREIYRADVIIGVKEVPLDRLYPNKTYVFFSHTIKAQPANMPALDDILAKKIRLIDYERICDENGRRLIKFGFYAGVCGAVDCVKLFGARLLTKGIATPFLWLGYTRDYPSLVQCYEALDHIGKCIAEDGFVPSIGPVIFSVCGTGAVSSGVLDVLKRFPHEFVSVEDLPSLMENYSLNKLYIVVTGRKNMYRSKTTGAMVTPEEYEANPQGCESIYAEKIAPYVSAIFNGVFWTAKYPRILTTEESRRVAKNWRLELLSDITADEGGSFEWMSKITTFDEPVTLWNPETDTLTDGIRGDGVAFYSVDHTPCEASVEASSQFSNKNVHYALALAEGKMLPELERATIADNGKLTERFSYINDLRKEKRREQFHVAVFGAGRVCPPFVEKMTQRKDVYITLISNEDGMAQSLASNFDRTKGVTLDINTDKDRAIELLKNHDLAISLLPPPCHPLVAELCLVTGRDLVTTSYVSPQMQELGEKASAQGLTWVNESGLDPGFDICEISRFVDNAKANNGKVRSVLSFCGGLASPECLQGNALSYAFSWSPAGVFRASSSPCTYLEDGKVKSSDDALSLYKPYDIGMPCLSLVGYPNRDSVVFAKRHGVDETCKTFIRGTFRFDPFCSVVQSFKAVGLLSQEDNELLSKRISWKDFVHSLAGGKLEEIFAKFPGTEKAYQDMGLLSEAFVPNVSTKPMLVLADYLGQKYAVSGDQADLIVMWHKFEVEYEDRHETTEMSFVRRGTDKSTAMSETVGITCAIAALGVKDGVIKKKGLVDPVDPTVYNLLLSELKKVGIEMTEKTFVQYK